MRHYFQKLYNHLNILGLYTTKHRYQLQILHVQHVGKNKVKKKEWKKERWLLLVLSRDAHTVLLVETIFNNNSI
jgi:hypothetical protein